MIPRAVLGIVPFVGMCKQHVAADLYATYSLCFRMDSSTAWVTSSRAMQPFIKISDHLWLSFCSSAVFSMSSALSWLIVASVVSNVNSTRLHSVVKAGNTYV